MHLLWAVHDYMGRREVNSGLEIIDKKRIETGDRVASYQTDYYQQLVPVQGSPTANLCTASNATLICCVVATELVCF